MVGQHRSSALSILERGHLFEIGHYGENLVYLYCVKMAMYELMLKESKT